MDSNTLLRYMPEYYKTSKVIENLNISNSAELTMYKEKRVSTLNQFYVETADYALDKWEKEFGLLVNNNLDIDLRRTKIKSILRGQGTMTKAMLKTLLKAMPYGDAEIIEYVSNNSFTIKFNNYYRIPINIPDILNIVDTIKPAHLAHDYTFAYNWWDYNVIKSKTWEAVGTWGNMRVYGEVV